MHYSHVVQIPGAEEDSALAVPIRVYWVERCAVVLIKGTLLRVKFFYSLIQTETSVQQKQEFYI